MTRFAIDRKNRDRKGGHEHTPIRKGPWAGADMKVARSTIKRYDKRLLRRQHNKAIAEGITAYHEDFNDRMGWLYALYGDFTEGTEDYQEWLNGYDEPEPYDDYFDYDDGPYNGMDDDYGGGDFAFGSNTGRCYHDRSTTSFLDRNTVEDLAHEVRRGMVKLELEVIENRDAGKSLGQLLRERLSRPF